jgi:hypothetical protein
MISIHNAVVTAVMHLCNMYLQTALEAQLTQLTVNQAAGKAVKGGG